VVYLSVFFISHNLATGIQYRRKAILCVVGPYICARRRIALESTHSQAEMRTRDISWGVDRQVDLHWVRALTVPMHLGLTDGPFVPHNLISAQERPVSLPKFQMTPRFKILMSSGSKKGT